MILRLKSSTRFSRADVTLVQLPQQVVSLYRGLINWHQHAAGSTLLDVEHFPAWSLCIHLAQTSRRFVRLVYYTLVQELHFFFAYCLFIWEDMRLSFGSFHFLCVIIDLIMCDSPVSVQIPHRAMRIGVFEVICKELARRGKWCRRLVLREVLMIIWSQIAPPRVVFCRLIAAINRH